MALLDGAMGLDAFKRVLGRSELSKIPFRPENLFQRRVVSLDPVVQIFSVQVPDSIAWPVPEVHFFDHLCIAVRLVCHDCQGVVAPWRFACLPHECPCRAGISASGEPEIDQLAALIDGPPKVAPTSVNTHIRFIHVPLQAAPRTMLTVGSLAYLWPKLLHSSIDRRRTNCDPSLSQKIPHITIG